MFKYLPKKQCHVLMAPVSRKKQMARIAGRLIGRKCDIAWKVSKSRVLIKIYQ